MLDSDVNSVVIESVVGDVSVVVCDDVLSLLEVDSDVDSEVVKSVVEVDSDVGE